MCPCWPGTGNVAQDGLELTELSLHLLELKGAPPCPAAKNILWLQVELITADYIQKCRAFTFAQSMFMMSEFAFYVVYFIVIISILLITLALDYMIKYE